MRVERKASTKKKVTSRTRALTGTKASSSKRTKVKSNNWEEETYVNQSESPLYEKEYDMAGPNEIESSTGSNMEYGVESNSESGLDYGVESSTETDMEYGIENSSKTDMECDDDSYVSGGQEADFAVVNGFSLYLKEIAKYPLLDAVQERELAKRSAAGDKAAMDKLIVSNLRLVVSNAKKYANLGVDMEDLVQVGNAGLMKCVYENKYNPNLGYRFSTYATWWIKQAMSRCIAEYGRPIHLPANTVYLANKLHREMQKLSVKYGHEPNLHTIADEMGMTEDEVINLLTLPAVGVSLDTPLGEDEDTFLVDTIVDEEAVSVEKQAEDLIVREEIMDLLQLLTERDREVLMYRFGFKDGEPYTLEEVGQIFGVSRERVRQIEKQAIENLRRCAPRQMAG